MSKFYSNYCNEHQGKPDFLIKEEINNERHRMHIMQANMTTNGKHTGSKSAKKLAYNANKIKRNISMIEAMLRRNA